MIAIIGAMECEVEHYKSILRDSTIKNISGFEFYLGKIEEVDVCIVKCGIGKVLSATVTTLLIQNFSPELVINTGIAGGSSLLKTEDVFVGSKFVYGDFDLKIFGYQRGQVPGFDQYFYPSVYYLDKFIDYLQTNKLKFKTGLVVTQDSFITNNEQIRDFELPLATDMEGASIAHVCTCFNVDFLSIRIISDIIGSDSQIDNYSIFEERAGKKSSQTTINFLKNLK